MPNIEREKAMGKCRSSLIMRGDESVKHKKLRVVAYVVIALILAVSACYVAQGLYEGISISVRVEILNDFPRRFLTGLEIALAYLVGTLIIRKINKPREKSLFD